MANIAPAQRIRAIYEGKPVDRLPRQEFYIWEEALAACKEQGMLEDWNEWKVRKAQRLLFCFSGFLPFAIGSQMMTED
jgi:hypothetical protein